MCFLFNNPIDLGKKKKIIHFPYIHFPYFLHFMICSA